MKNKNTTLTEQFQNLIGKRNKQNCAPIVLFTCILIVCFLTSNNKK